MTNIEIARNFFTKEIILKTLGRHRLKFFSEIPSPSENSPSGSLFYQITSPYQTIRIRLFNIDHDQSGNKTSAACQRHIERTGRRGNEIALDYKEIAERPEIAREAVLRATIADKYLHPNFSKILKPSPIQKRALDAIEESRTKGFKRGLVTLPTGTGKTILAVLDSKKIGGRVLFVAHQNIILEQAARKFKERLGAIDIGFLHSEADNKNTEAHYLFANVASLRGSKLKQFPKSYFDYIVIDECHHSAAQSYTAITKHFTPKFLLGITATPDRTDQKEILGNFSNNHIFCADLRDAIKCGALVPFKYYGLSDGIDYTNIRHNGFRYYLSDLERSLSVLGRNSAILREFQNRIESRQTIGFCVSISHAESIAEFFRENGVNATAIHSGLSKEEKELRVRGFANKTMAVAFVRDMFNEGADFPEVSALMFLRPTESKLIFLQQLGRGLRIAPGKPDVIVLDFIGNYIGAQDIVDFMLRLVRLESETISVDALGDKPHYSLDTGCEIAFERQLIKKINFRTAPAVNIERLIYLLIRLYRNAGRPLNPVDLLIHFNESPWPALRSFGGYSKLVERMNSLEEGIQILDTEYSEFAPEHDLEVSEVSDQFFFHGKRVIETLEIIKVKIESSGRKHFDHTRSTCHEELRATYRSLAFMCLCKDTIELSEMNIASHLSSRRQEDKQNPDSRRGPSREAFFKELSRKSRHRNSFAICNALERWLAEDYSGLLNHSYWRGSKEIKSQASFLDLLDSKFLSRYSDFLLITTDPDL